MSGVPIKSSINANQTRVDFLDLSHWGRAVMQDIDYFDVGGQTVFPIYGESAGSRPRIHLLLRHRIPGVERFAAQRRVHRRARPPLRLLIAPFRRNPSRPGYRSGTTL